MSTFTTVLPSSYKTASGNRCCNSDPHCIYLWPNSTGYKTASGNRCCNEFIYDFGKFEDVCVTKPQAVIAVATCIESTSRNDSKVTKPQAVIAVAT